jgi:ketosteroid isomerase-like protein
MTNEKEKEIETLLRSYETALDAVDTNSIMDLLGTNPVFIIQNSPAQVGRDTIRKQTDQTFKATKFDIHFNVQEVEILGDLAWARTSHPRGNQLWIFHRENDKWKVHRYSAAANSPPQTS